MAKNKITDLRDHLFETLEALKDPDKPMELQRAHAIAEVAQAIINSAKVEVDLVKAVSGSRAGSEFFNLPQESRTLPQIPRGSDLDRDKQLRLAAGATRSA
jgi:hypothetical protein